MTPTWEVHLRRVEGAVISGQEGPILSAVMSFLEAAPEGAAIQVWARFRESHDLYLRRVISYALATSAGTQPRLLWAPLADLVASPSQDTATLTNIGSALQIYDSHDDALIPAVAPNFGAYASRCLLTNALTADGICNLLVHLSDRKVLARLLSSAQVTQLAEELRATAGRVGIDADEALDALEANTFAEMVPDASELLLKAELTVGDVVTGLGDAVVLAFESVLSEARASYEMRGQAAEVNGVVEQVRLDGSEAARGRLGVETLERLIHSWKATLRESLAALSPVAAAEMTTYVLVPARGSFVLRFLVQAPEISAVTRSLEDIAKLTELPDSLLGDQGISDKVKAELFGFLETLANGGLNASISLTDAHLFTRPQTRLVADDIGRRLQQFRERKTEKSELRNVTGTLEGANHRHGTFEILADDSQLIRGDVPRRAVLLRKVIGQRYRFGVKETITTGFPGEERRHTVLLSVDGVEASPLVDVGSIQPLPNELDSDDVPQQDLLDRIVQVVRIVAQDEEVTPVAMEMTDDGSSRRHIQYMKHAARALGLMLDSHTLTSSGRTLALMPESRVLHFLAAQFEVSVVARMWKKWAKAKDVYELDPDGAVEFLRFSGLSESMAERRGRTLRRWVETFKSIPKTNLTSDNE